MPNLNVKGDSPKTTGSAAGSASGGGGSKVIIIIVVAIIALGAVAFILNTMGVVKLWGKKKAIPQVVALPPENFSPVTTPEVAQPVEQQAVETTPIVENNTKVETSALPSVSKKNIVSGTGMYTVQISSWPIEAKANAQAQVFTDAGFDAFVEPLGAYFRVCVGRFGTKSEAKSQMEKMEPMLESKPVVAKVGK
ncbi:MAG: SPOR domain-containing protein [Bacteroidota bacterium]|nr:SPOR domain-containing protein [Bacteroidota bacterium]